VVPEDDVAPSMSSSGTIAVPGAVGETGGMSDTTRHPDLLPTGPSVDATAPAAPTAGTAAAPSARWRLIDSIRGFALVGILFANVPSMVFLGLHVPGEAQLKAHAASAVDSWVLPLLVESRFVPIFCFLFGLSLQLIVASARRRGVGPWRPLLLRLGSLLVIGVLHGLLWGGDVLRVYAVAALLLLPLAILAPRVVVLAGGVVLTAVGFGVLGGGPAGVPGLLLLGSAAASYGLPAALDRGGRRVALAFAGLVVLAVGGSALQVALGSAASFGAVSTTVGLVTSAVYVTGLALLWQTRLRGVIAGALEPLGRMALTNYLGATVVVVAVAYLVPAIDWKAMPDSQAVVPLAVAVLTVQSLASRLWLRHFSYGPVEWAWRSVTWRRRAPLRGGVL